MEIAFPIENDRWVRKLGRFYKWQMKNLDFRRWTNYKSPVKYGPNKDYFKTRYPF